MHRFFIPQPYSDTMTIMGVDARHIYTVLRMQCGSRVQIVSDDGVTALAEIADANESVVTVKCLEVLAESHEPSVRIVLAQGLAKGEKMDFIIQKAVELGVSEIIPVAMEHSVVRLEGDKAVKKAERWQKIAEAAAKQSKRDIIPMVQPVQTMEQMLADNPCDCKLIAYECEDKLGLKAALQKEQALKELLLIIGPEGGISETELQQSRMPGKELCWRVPEDMPLKNEKWALVPCKEHLYLVEILRKEWVEDNIAEQYRRVYAIGSTREELKPPIGRVHLIDADRIDMPGEVSYHAVENSKLSKPDVMELLQYPIGVTLEADGRYRVFLGAYRVWYLRECMHWTKIPCYVYKIKRQIRDPRERRRREIHRRQQAAESPRIRLQLYENYYKLLKGMKDAGEIKGGLQTRLMQLLGVSERTVRIYKQLSEQLTGREKQHLMRGKLPFVQARAVAAERNQKAAMLPDFEEVEDNKDKNLPANNGE